MVKLCRTCRWSRLPTNTDSTSLRCVNPEVNKLDPRALATSGVNYIGSDCHSEREHMWFPICGMTGKQWEPRDDFHVLFERSKESAERLERLVDEWDRLYGFKRKGGVKQCPR